MYDKLREENYKFAQNRYEKLPCLGLKWKQGNFKTLMTSDSRAQPDKEAKWQENAAWWKRGRDDNTQEMTKQKHKWK